MPENKKLLPYVAGGAAAIGTFAAARRLNFRGLTEAQKAARGSFHVGSYDPSKPKTLGQKILHHLRLGDTKHHMVGQRKYVPGAYYHEAEPMAKSVLPKAGVSYNVDPQRNIANVLQDKVRYGKLKSDGSILPAQTVREFVKSRLGRDAKDVKELRSVIDKNIPTRYIKKIRDEASKGLHMGKPSTRVSDYQKLYRSPDKYLIQPKIKADPVVYKGKKGLSGEVRLDFLVDSGIVKPIQKLPRYPAGKAPDSKLPISFKNLAKAFSLTSRQIQPELQKIVSKNPKVFKDRAILGADVIRDKKGKIRVIEINDQSGLYDVYPPGAHRLYKAVTGRDTKVVAGLKGLAVGTGTTLVGKRERKKS